MHQSAVHCAVTCTLQGHVQDVHELDEIAVSLFAWLHGAWASLLRIALRGMP